MAIAFGEARTCLSNKAGIDISMLDLSNGTNRRPALKGFIISILLIIVMETDLSLWRDGISS
jgi:hypothetical protein